jgi:hypothetical protein
MVKQPLRLTPTSAICDEKKGPRVCSACTEYGGRDISQIARSRHSREILERVETGVLLQADGPESRSEQEEAKRLPLTPYIGCALPKGCANFGLNTIDVNVELILGPAVCRVYRQTNGLDRDSTIDSFEDELSGIECRMPELLAQR